MRSSVTDMVDFRKTRLVRLGAFSRAKSFA